MDEDEAIIADEDLDVIEGLDPVEDGEELGESNGEEEAEESLRTIIPAVYKPRLVKILRDLQSPEIKIYSVASKEFVDLLRSDSGGEVLLEYVKSSPGCAELDESWRAHRGKPGMSYILSLISVVLDHPAGKLRSSGICRNLDNFARAVVGSKLDDIYIELSSQESRRQSAGLTLLASVVRRGMSLASDVAKAFNFKLPVLTKLSGVRRKKTGNKGGKEKEHHVKRATRRAFVEFAMSFLEVGNPRLLRWVLQQREMYSGVLRVLGSDDAETVVHILSTLRGKVLVPESLVPPGLRSVLFGSVTLEQLICVSGNPEAGMAADIAHEVLVKVCTDPVNGLMPSSTGKGNEKRLFELMKKLKATEAQYHKDLLLAIVKCRLSFCSAYMDDFPYHLEPRATSLWFGAISLAADIIASVNADTLIASIGVCSHDSVLNELQNVLKCIIPRTFTRPVINKGLLHPDVLVKHGSLRVLLESIKLVSGLISRIDDIVEGSHLRLITEIPGESMAELHGLPELSCIAEIDRFLGMDKMSHSHSDEHETVQWVSIKQYIQDEVRVLLPDPQVLVKLLSTPSSRDLKQAGISLKRCASLSESGLQKSKKLKSESVDGNIDLVIGGVDDELTTDISEIQKKAKSGFTENELDVEKGIKITMAEIWGLNKDSSSINELRDPEIYLYSKLLNILTFYLRAMPAALDSTFDFFKILPNDPLNLSFDQQQSLFSLLIECIGQSPGSNTATRAPELMYRHLQPLVNTLIFSEDINVRGQAYILAQAAMVSTGAFDQNLLEVDAWLAFIPGLNMHKIPGRNQITEMFHDWSKVVVSFLCDAVSTIGNNLYKYMDHMRQLILEVYGDNDCSPDFSPLTICVLQKCLRLLESDSGVFKLHEKSCISSYVCSTLILISQMEVGTTLLPRLIQLVLGEKFKHSCSNNEDSKASLCEWMPLRNLLIFVRNIVDRPSSSSFCPMESTGNVSGSSFISILEKVKEFLKHDHAGGLEGVAFALSSSILCASRDDILKTFPLLVMTSQVLFRSDLQLLSWAFFSDPRFIADVANQWSDMFFSAFVMIGSNISYDGKHDSDIISSEDTTFILRSIHTDHVDQTESAALAFSLLLKQSSFYVLLSGFMSFGSCKLDSTKILGILRSTRVLDLLRVKLFEGAEHIPLSYVQCLLFWLHQILSAYRAKPCDVLEELFHINFSLIEHLFEHLVARFSDALHSKTSCKSIVAQFQEAIDLVIHHPAITLSFLCPLSHSEKVQSDDLGDCVEAFLASSKQCYHPMDQRVLHFSKKVFDFLIVFGNGYPSYNLNYTSFEQILKAPADLVGKTELLFKEKFELCVMVRDLGPLLPSFYAFHALAHLKSPFELLRLVCWMFCKLGNDKSGYVSAYVPAVCVALFIADIALDMLYNKLKQPTRESRLNLFLDLNSGGFDVSILKNIYSKILDFAIFFNLRCADECLFKVLNAVHKQKFEKPQPALFPLYMLSLRMIVGCPTKTFLHLFYPASKTKAKTLLHLIEASPVHMSLFGKIFTAIVNNNSSVVDVLNMGRTCLDKSAITVERSTDALLEDDFVLMLPAALSYLMENINETQKQDFKIFENMLAFYSRILLDGFCNWKMYVSGDIFHEVFDDLALEALADFSQLFSCSLLGKAIRLLQYAFAINGISVGTQQKLKIFDSLYPCSSESDEILDAELEKIDTLTFNESLRLANEITGKLTFTSLLLFRPEKSLDLGAIGAYEKLQEMPAPRESNRLNSARLRFLNILVNTLEYVVGKCPWRPDGFLTPCHADAAHLLRYLEQSILQNIIQIFTKIQSYLTQLPSIPFLIPFIRSSLLYRFEDPVRLKAIRCLISLSQGSFSYSEVFDLLLGHSKFVPTILYSDSTSDPFAYSSTGAFLQPVPSILKSIVSPSIEQQNIEKNRCGATLKSTCKSGALRERKLELIKLLRVLLYHVKGKQQTFESSSTVGLNSRELISLLLSGYGATMGELDLETLHLMHEIESIEGSSYDIISELDYLWGASAMKTRKELALYGVVALNQSTSGELMEEQHRRLFRENIPVDSGLCVLTVLHFCNDRASRTGALSVKRLVDDNFMISAESVTIDIVQGYDPAFILRFAIHSLMVGYVEPIEFSQVGLLAVTLVSISSADEEIRKLGYESLGRFKQALEKIRSKDALQIQLLLAYLQNGIAEPWQKIPSVIAIFAAEASLVLLDPSQDRFRKISKLLVHSPRVNLKTVPLLHTMFASDSIHFRSDCLWILRLLFAGLNSYDDAKIYMGNNLLELLLSFYSSSLSDFESNMLILQIVNKAVKVRLLANYLVKEWGLISWLSTIISSCGQQLDGGKKETSLKAVTCALKVVSDVLSLRTITEWLQEYGLEQLSDLSSHLHSLLLGSLKFLTKNITLVNSILHVIKSTLMISHKRKIYQPHFLLSLEGLFLLCEGLHSEFDGVEFEDTFQLGVDILLWSLPVPVFSHMECARLAKLIILATSAALSSSSHLSKEPDPGMVLHKEQRGKESVFMKLLRWITASVILGRVSGKSPKTNSKILLTRTGLENLQSLVEAVEEEKDASREEDFRSNEALALLILYLQQLLGMNLSTISSVVSALCLLLLPSSSITVKEFLDKNRATIAFLCSKIRCPVEANPAWRWSYYQPWNNNSSSRTDAEEMEEKHACQSLLMIFSNAFGGEPLGLLPPLSHEDVEVSELFDWEKQTFLQRIQ